MNVLKYILDKSYRKHRWAARHLPYYRNKPDWLHIRRSCRIIGRLWSKKIIEAVLRRDVINPRDTIIIPKISEIKLGDNDL